MNASKLQNLAMNDNGFIFDPSSGYSYTTNETGIFILRQLALGESKESICKSLCETYDCTEDHFNNDYAHFMLMLEALDLVNYEETMDEHRPE